MLNRNLNIKVRDLVLNHLTLFHQMTAIRCKPCGETVHAMHAEVDQEGQVWLIYVCKRCATTWRRAFVKVTLIE